jgi:hypothetical protein
MTNRQKELLRSATYQVVAHGGPQSAALDAIAALDWSRYFVPATATTAVPIAFTVRTLKGREVATIHDDVVYDMRDGCRPPASYTVDVTLTRVERRSGFCLACVFSSWIGRPGAPSATLQTGVFGPSTGPMSFNTSRTVTLAPGQKLDLCSSFDITQACAPYGYPGAVNGNLNNMKTLDDGREATRTVDVNTTGASGRFTYRVRKRANYL